MLYLSNNLKEKKKKRNINIDLAILPSHDITGLGHINILLDLSFIRDYRMLLYMIGMMEKMLGFWDANLFFPFLMWGVLGL